MPEPETQPGATSAGSFDLNRPTIVALLFVASYITGITGIVGIVLAYVWKAEPHQPWEATHYTYLIRTFWIGFGAAILGMITLIIGIGFLIMLAIGIWVLVRSVLSIVNAQKRAPMPNPGSWLI